MHRDNFQMRGTPSSFMISIVIGVSLTIITWTCGRHIVMARIKIYTLAEATGLLKELYQAAIRRAGRVWNIVSVMGQNPPAMKASMEFYVILMRGPSPLSRMQREMLAVVVSSANHCVY